MNILVNLVRSSAVRGGSPEPRGGGDLGGGLEGRDGVGAGMPLIVGTGPAKVEE